jgi:hypothetical protein
MHAKSMETTLLVLIVSKRGTKERQFLGHACRTTLKSLDERLNSKRLKLCKHYTKYSLWALILVVHTPHKKRKLQSPRMERTRKQREKNMHVAFDYSKDYHVWVHVARWVTKKAQAASCSSQISASSAFHLTSVLVQHLFVFLLTFVTKGTFDVVLALQKVKFENRIQI